MITPEDAEIAERQTQMREFFQLRVFVVGGGFPYSKMFFDAGLKGARSVEDADIICFTGGHDVDPALYGEKALECTGFSQARDEYESKIFAQAVLAKKPMVGICRGGQFLNVMNKGKLWQDVNNHAIAGVHDVTDMRTKEVKEGMTSTHHQMMIPAKKDAEVIALACLSTRKTSAKRIETQEKPSLEDVEVVWYPKTLCLCFQPHPEYKLGGCRNYFFELFDEFIIPAT